MKTNDDQIEGEHQFLRNPEPICSYCSRTCQYIDLVFYITCKL
ncbi:hypothetical protein Hanom_Chr15g01346281 [Helianthus anomalus]